MKSCLTLLLFFSVFSLFANDEGGSISGKVVDSVSGSPIAYATIILKDKNNNTKSGGITEEDGSFVIKELELGDYVLECQFIGYKSYQTNVRLTKATSKVDVGKILLVEEAENLSEIQVRSEVSTVVQKIDRKVITVGKDLATAGATASEIMNNIQSVSVDQDGNISLRGNSNVRVLVDGRPTNIDPAQLLKQIPSTSIKSIELITNPSAKYNPEGMSGIINIVLNKNANLGFNGNVNGGFTYGANDRYNGSLDLNYRTEKLNFFGNYGFNTGPSHNFGEVYNFDDNYMQKFVFDNDNTSHLLKAGFDFYMDDKNTLSLFTVQNRFDSDFDGSTRIFFDGEDPFIDQDNFTESENNTKTYNINYKHDFEKEGHNLEFEGNYTRSESPEYAVFDDLVNPDDPILSYEDRLENDQENVTLNLDYVNPLNDKSKLELGLESRIRKMDNSRQTTQHDFVVDDNGNIIGTAPVEDAFYQYDRDIHSAYATYSNGFGKFDYQIGFRLESYEVEAVYNGEKVFEDDYITVYPSGFLTYKPSDKNHFQISFSRRVDRPGFGQVNPIREWSTPLVTSVGNPELDPQFTNSFELNYTRNFEKGSLTSGVFYRMITDNITRVLLVDPLNPDKVILTFGNTDDNNAYGFELSGNYKPTNWWSFNGSFDWYHQVEKGIVGLEEIEVENNTWNLRANNDFKVAENLRFQLFGMYRGQNRNLQFEVKPMWKIDLGLRWNVLNNNGTISARVTDIFNTMFFAFDSETPYNSTGEFHWESRTVYLGFSYQFGNNAIKGRNRKDRSGNDKQSSGFL